MMVMVPFKPEHLDSLKLQNAEAELQEYIKAPGYGESLVNPWTFSGFIDDKMVGVCGILPIWKGRAQAWALLSSNLDRRHFISAHTQARKVLDLCHLDGFKRIEATVDEDFSQGHRWVKALGFRREGEGVARWFSPEGRTHIRYERIAG